jgi:hypothetical protein
MWVANVVWFTPWLPCSLWVARWWWGWSWASSMVSMVTGCNSLERKTKTAVGLRVNITAARHVTGSWLIGSFIQLEALYLTFDWCSWCFRPETGTKPNLHYFIRLQNISCTCRTKAATSSTRSIAIHRDRTLVDSTSTVSFIQHFVVLETCGHGRLVFTLWYTNKPASLSAKKVASTGTY